MLYYCEAYGRMVTLRILFIAMANSIHTARWVNQLNTREWDIHLFPVASAGIHSDFRNLTIHDFLGSKPSVLHPSVHIVGSWPLPRGVNLAKCLVKQFAPSWDDRAWRLARTIRVLRPDIIHSLEIQHAGYLTFDARKFLGDTLPPWIVTNWGSDISLFGRLSEHVEKIKSILSTCDYYTCECHRDVALARAFGFKGDMLPVLPVTGGYDIAQIRQLREPGLTSSRRIIVLRGYQSWSGRALVGLRGIELCADVLQGYRVAIHSAAPEVRIAAELVTQATRLPIDIVPYSPHRDILRLHGRARVSLGLSISDGISPSLLEAMIMGSFPIQSHTGCADEWIRHGETGLLVHPEDPEPVAAAIQRAVTDDALVNRAAELNARLVVERLDQSVIQPQVIAMYEKIIAPGKQRSTPRERGRMYR